MNQKTSKLIQKFATINASYAKTDPKKLYKSLKNNWLKQTSKNRGFIRGQMIQEIE